jgi:hypothetical protein
MVPMSRRGEASLPAGTSTSVTVHPFARLIPGRLCRLCDDAGVFRAAAHFFAESEGSFHPTESALSRWGHDSLNGPAIVGLAARVLEREYGIDGFLPTRLTADLFKAARRAPTEIRTRLVRDGRRIRNSECDVIQDGAVVARASMVQYRQSEPPPGQEWVGAAAFAAPPGVAGAAYVVGSDAAGWSDTGAEHQNTSRKRVYHRTIDVVEGEQASPFLRAVVASEATLAVLGDHIQRGSAATG